MKNMKKVLAGLLAGVMVVSGFTGCGKKGDDLSEEVTLRWALGRAEQEDSEMVMEEVNEKLEELLPNTKLEFIYDSSMASKWSLWMAGGEKIDIAHAGFFTDIQTEINMESYMPLNDLIEQYAPNIKEQSEGAFKDLFNCGVYQGETYAIPVQQIYVKDSLMLYFPDELSQYIDINAIVEECYASSTTTERVYEELDKFLQNVRNAGVIGTDKIADIIDPETMYLLAKRGYEFIGGTDSSVCYKMASEGPVEIVDFHTTEEFKTHIKWMSKWNQEGFVSKDILTGGSAGSKVYLLDMAMGSREDEGQDHTYVSYYATAGINRRYICLTNPELDYKGSSQLGYLKTYNAIPSTSEHPERAMMLLDLLYSEKGAELLNLINYGIEGVHYEKTSDTEIKAYDYEIQPVSGSKYGIASWSTANMFNSYIISPYTQKTYDYAKEYFENINPNRPTTPMYGYSFDSGELTLKLSNIGLVNQEYEFQLICGVYADYSSVYDTLISKTGDSGLADVISEYQTQADEYTKSK